MSEIDEDIGAFLSGIDVLVQRLNPKRRPQDAAAPECTAREIDALQVLSRHGRVTMSSLAALIDVPLSTATRIVERLVSKDLVKRSPSESDRRVVEVAFGPLGQQIDRYIQRSRRAEARRMLGALSREERTEFLRLLARMAAEKVSAAGSRHCRRSTKCTS